MSADTKTSTAEIKITSTPSKPGGEPPSKTTKRTISEVSDASAEELTIIHQQLDHLTSDLKDTKTRVMNLISKDDVQTFISETINKVMGTIEKKMELLIENKIKEKTKTLEEKVNSLEFDKKNLTDRLIQAETDIDAQRVRLSEL